MDDKRQQGDVHPQYTTRTDRAEHSQDDRPEYNQSATGAGAATGQTQEGKAPRSDAAYFGEFRVGAITLSTRADGLLVLRHENTGTVTEVAEAPLAQVLSDVAFPPDSELGKLAKKKGFEQDTDQQTNGSNFDGSFVVGSLTLAGGGANPLRLSNSHDQQLEEEVDELTLEGALEDAFFTRKIDDKGGEKQGEATKGT